MDGFGLVYVGWEVVRGGSEMEVNLLVCVYVSRCTVESFICPEYEIWRKGIEIRMMGYEEERKWAV